MPITLHRRSILLFVFIFAAAIPVLSQKPAAASLDDILDRAATARKAYLEQFRDLIAPEKRTFTIFGKNGEPKKTRKVESTFIIYRVPGDAFEVNEFRSVKTVDGKPVEGAEQRASDLFAQLSSGGAAERTLNKLQDESARFDLEIVINNLTLLQAMPLASEIRRVLSFKREASEGTLALVISYQQNAASSDIVINDKDRTEAAIYYDVDTHGLKNLEPRIRGRLYLDPTTFRLIREVRELTVQPEGFPGPVVVARDEFNYQPSRFEILTPSKIVHTQFQLQRKERSARVEAAVTFEYGEFIKPETEVREIEEKP